VTADDTAPTRADAGSWRSVTPSGSDATFGPYRLTGELGRGAMGTVYRAVDPQGRTVALKLPHASAGPRTLARLQREGRLAAQLDHPGIVRVLDAGEVGGRPYVAYVLVEGCRTLAEVLKRTPPPRARTVALLRDVAAALGHAHARGIVHRDVKPENILVDLDGRPIVADLGISSGDDEARLTQTGQVFGTPQYMAPEQLLGRPTTPATDVWALGVTLYEALTRELPFPQSTLAELSAAVASPPAPLRSLDPTIAAPLEAVVLRALSPRPEERPADGAALAAALDEALAPPAARPRARVALLVVPLAALALSGVLAVFAVTRAPPPPAPPPPPPATTQAPPSPATPEAPAWISALAPGARPPWPLPQGLLLGAGPGQVVSVADGSLLAWVPPGRLHLGGDGEVACEVDVPGCFVGVHEVTFGQFRRFCRETGRMPPDPRIEGYPTPFSATDDHPVFHVTWFDAAAYCAWAGLRLPREAEWEHAARGDDPARRWPWGADLDRAGPPAANVADLSARGLVGPEWGLYEADYDDGHFFPAPVGSYPAGASPSGCLDLAGNVWEWTADGWAPYPPPERPAETAAERVTRGGSWDNKASFSQVGNRGHMRASGKAPFLGLRVARSP
jgi:serine/threonine protein kinase/formylglycine-generating enzyme required for sulfatase activity